MSERVLVIGAGIAGLCTALALAPTGRKVTLLERDPAPPSADPNAAFEDWARRGVGHLRHSHAFLARLRLIFRDEHPELLKELMATGCREVGFDRMISDIARPLYRPEPGDADFTIMFSRRTTPELVVRRYVERMANVEIRSEVFVRELMTQPDAGGAIRVTGVRTETGDILADLVVDAAGRTSESLGQLIEAGAAISEEAEPAGILYFTRHYRMRPGAAEPAPGKLRTTGDLGYIKFGIFPGDNDCFSITLCVPEIELEMRKAIVRPEVFDAVCRELPGVVPWLEPETSEPVSKVFGMGDLVSRWRDLVIDGKPSVLGFVPLGDSLIRTNPLYGRGCSFAAIEAYLLKDALRSTPDPAQRLVAYHAAVRRELRPYYDAMLEQDRSAIRRARQALIPGHTPSLRGKVMRSFMEDGVGIAMRSDPDLMREGMRAFHMLQHPTAWMRKPANMAKIMKYWSRGKRRNADAYPMTGGPDREGMMRAVGVDPLLDVARVAETA